MNLQQLEYVLAVSRHRHFARAAEKSNVTQPTLSMMIKKLEDELGVKIFDRKKSPVETTPEGKEIIERAAQILADVTKLKEYVQGIRLDVSGEINLAIIPTLAPYLLPLFLQSFIEKHPALKVNIRELVTPDLVAALKSGAVDIGLLATPTNDDRLIEQPVFYEEFIAYVSENERAYKKRYVLPKDIDLSKLWLLEEGHCMRNQVFNLCELKKRDIESDRLHYQAGSLETLKNLVDHNKGITILPYLATLDLSRQQQKQLREFAPPTPVREISLVVNANFSRKAVLNALRVEIDKSVPIPSMGNKKMVLGIA
jgi:LysR family transcriptional regulator, hydrogen peroxide-inducible genes activator